MSVRVSGKTLAELAMSGTCPSCFRMKVYLNSLDNTYKKKIPFQMPMPGIFANIDSHIKQVVKHCFESKKEMPCWFPDIGTKIISIEDPPGWQNFNIYIEKYDLTLTGALDVIFKLEDGSYAFGDYKTARFSDTHDSLMPLYKAQLHAYMDIAKAKNIFQPVSKLFLIYAEPIVFKIEDNFYKTNDFEEIYKLHFKITEKLFDIELDLTKNLLKKAIQILNGPYPKGMEDCPDCALRERLYQQEFNIKNILKGEQNG